MRFRRDNTRGRIEAVCKHLVDATKDLTTWTWDDEYFAALAVLGPEGDDEVLAALREVFPHAWNHVEISSAPERVRHVCGVWGGLVDGQVLYVLEPEADPMLFAAWWPWGTRTKSSLRVSCAARSEVVAKTDPQGWLRTLFGL